MQSRMIFEVDERLPSCHSCTVAELDHGRLMAAWYAGAAEKEPDVDVFAARLEPGAREWDDCFPLVGDPGHSLGNPVLFAPGGGTLFLFWARMMGDRDWNTCRLYMRESADNGASWGPDRVLREELGCMVKYPPLVLDGEWLLPLYDEVNGTTEWLCSADRGRSWEFRGRIESFPMNAQAAGVRLSDGSLLAYMRCIKHGTEIRNIIASVSADRGRTWTRGRTIELPNPDSAASLIRLQSGRLLLVYNNSRTERNPLTVAVSDDEGRTWRNAFDLESAPGGSFAYPHSLQARDGVIHTVYSYHRSGIKHVAYPESDLD